MAVDRGFASVAQVRLFGGLELLGPIVALQVQASSLKQGERPRRWYDPAPITRVPRLRLDPGGVTGLADDPAGTVPDVHHRDHQASKFRGENGISFGFTSHYATIRDAYGEHMTDGIAGENILIQCDRPVPPDNVRHGIVIVSGGAQVPIDAVEVAAPCVEFSRFTLRYDADQPTDKRVSETVSFLHNGVRGYYATVGGENADAVISVGDLVYRRESA